MNKSTARAKANRMHQLRQVGKQPYAVYRRARPAYVTKPKRTYKRASAASQRLLEHAVLVGAFAIIVMVSALAV